MFEYLRFVTRNASYVTKNARQSWTVRKAMQKHKMENPFCAWCGRSKKLETHHIEPVSVAPEKAADPFNMISLCRKPACHQIIGHDGDFARRYVENVLELCSNNKTISVGNMERRIGESENKGKENDEAQKRI